MGEFLLSRSHWACPVNESVTLLTVRSGLVARNPCPCHVTITAYYMHDKFENYMRKGIFAGHYPHPYILEADSVLSRCRPIMKCHAPQMVVHGKALISIKDDHCSGYVRRPFFPLSSCLVLLLYSEPLTDLHIESVFCHPCAQQASLAYFLFIFVNALG